jgi:hypothetical protein
MMPRVMRVRGILLSALTLASLLLFLAIVSLWVRSRWTADVVTFAGTRMFRVASHDGGVSIGSFRLVRRLGSWRNPSAPMTETPLDYAPVVGAGQLWTWETIAARAPVGPTTRNVPLRLTDRVWLWPGGSVWPRSSSVERSRQTRYDNVTGALDDQVFTGERVWFPCWILSAATATAPLLWLRARLRRARRADHDLCPRCGYDLRATPDRCPECGRKTNE